MTTDIQKLAADLKSDGWPDTVKFPVTLTVAEIRQIAALLRFQSAMTPEMWALLRMEIEDVRDDKQYAVSRLELADDPQATQGEIDAARARLEPWQAILAALDTLRQEIQQP